MTEALRKRLRFIFGLLVWAGLIAALVAGWDQAGSALASSAPVLALAVPLIVTGLLAAAQGWAVLQPPELQPRAFRAFLAAQPAKYLPGGGAFQLVGQIGLTSRDKGDRPRAGVAFAVHAFIQVAAASSLALLLLLDNAPPWLKTVVTAAAVTALVLIRQPVLEAGVSLIQRVVQRIDLSGGVPSTATLWRSWAWSLVPMLLSGLAFTGLAGAFTSLRMAFTTIGIFALAWVVGFLVFPLPSGLGLREVVMIGLMMPLPSSTVIATSLLHRFSTLVAELLVLAFVSRGAFVSSSQPK